HEEWLLSKLPVWSFKAKVAPQNANCLGNCKLFTCTKSAAPKSYTVTSSPKKSFLTTVSLQEFLILDCQRFRRIRLELQRESEEPKGYVAPEWFRNMPITAKVDVYSYGTLLLELICCRRNFEAEAVAENQMILADWSCDCYKLRKLDMLVVNDDEALADMNRVENCVMIIAIWCIQENPSLRPTMKKVIEMLEGEPLKSQFPKPISICQLFLDI
ncbi:LOW QUALITY PROTEIN: Tyrosine-protein kinase, partial [Trema orientale]